jgi:hypothetical protein
MPFIRDKYHIVKKAEQDRIVGTSFIPSYGKFPVHNERYNKLVQYLEKVNKNLQVENPTQNQKNLQDLISEQINLSRLKILNDQYLNEKKEGGIGSSALTALGFRNWCGAGTPLYNNIKDDLDDPNKMYAIDRICVEHDIAFTKSKTFEEQQEADFKMIKEIFSKYVLNLNRNFITGNYESDFTDWTTTSKTVINYLLSGVETYYTYHILKDIPKSIYEFLKLPYKYITEYLEIKHHEDYFKDIKGDIENQLPNSDLKTIYNDFVEIPKKLQSLRFNTIKMEGKQLAGNLALKYYGTTLIQDKIFALSAMAGIILKVGLETFLSGALFKTNEEPLNPSFKMVDFTKHEVSEEDLKNLIEVFETLQNEYLKESNLEPIKIGNEWTSEKIEYPSVPELTKDINHIVSLNMTYNQEKEKIDNSIYKGIQEKEQLKKEENLKVYDEIYNLIDELEKEERADNLKVYDEIYDLIDELEKEEQNSLVPNLPQDVIEGKEQNIVDEQDEESEEQNNEIIKNNKDEL